MRIGILGDVHGNMEALEAVTKAMLEEGVDLLLPVPKGLVDERLSCTERLQVGRECKQVDFCLRAWWV